MKIIKVEIAKDGSSTKIEVDGIAGASCEDVTKNLIEALGTAQSSEKTPDFFQSDVDVVTCNT